MADIIQAPLKGKRKRQSTRVDLTPMVDLGFLLITFFVFTTTLSSHKAMAIYMPAKGGVTHIPESGAVTLIPDGGRVWYFEGEMPADKKALYHFPYAEKTALRDRLMQLRQSLVAKNGNDDKMVVMIKPTTHASFGQVVDILDEMTICAIKKYSLLEIGAGEQELVAGKE